MSHYSTRPFNCQAGRRREAWGEGKTRIFALAFVENLYMIWLDFCCYLWYTVCIIKERRFIFVGKPPLCADEDHSRVWFASDLNMLHSANGPG